MQQEVQPVISVKEAREIMGTDAESMSDDEIVVLIDRLNSLARGFVLAVQNGVMYETIMKYNKSENDEVRVQSEASSGLRPSINR